MPCTAKGRLTLRGEARQVKYNKVIVGHLLNMAHAREEKIVLLITRENGDALEKEGGLKARPRPKPKVVTEKALGAAVPDNLQNPKPNQRREENLLQD